MSLSTVVRFIVIDWLMKSKVPSDVAIFSCSDLESLLVDQLAVSDGVVFEFSVDISGGHFAFRIGLTHILQDDLGFYSVVCFWSGSMLICPHYIKYTFGPCAATAHVELLCIW